MSLMICAWTELCPIRNSKLYQTQESKPVKELLCGEPFYGLDISAYMLKYVFCRDILLENEFKRVVSHGKSAVSGEKIKTETAIKGKRRKYIALSYGTAN